jgi:uncharacterized surface protein with fasciclin (FAS1) repeats
MKRRFLMSFNKLLIKSLTAAIGILFLISCHEDYELDEKEPEWLGASIYDYLNDNGNFTNLINLIDDLEYTAVLSKTGSKTVFAADDEAFARFFADNEWNVSEYKELSNVQKNLLLKFAMIDNAYLIETLANYNYLGGLNLGTAIRRNSSIAETDYIPFVQGSDLPQSTWWDSYRDKGLYLAKDATNLPIVHFLESSLDNAGISKSDFELITGVERSDDDAHLFNVKVIERDITCKNGYVHIIEDVLVPRVNIAEYLHQNPKTQIFSRLLDRFSAPYYNASVTTEYNRIEDVEPIDSIFEKIYFSPNDGAIRYPNYKKINEELLLPFNPGRNTYSKGPLQSDMAAVLAPSDDAMNAYFESGVGTILQERYVNWDGVPDGIVVLLLKRHLRESFLESVPSLFPQMTDSENSSISAKRSDITNSYVGVNGVVYLTNKVYSPDDYVSVYGPVLFSEKTKVFNWAIQKNDFRLYLNSLVSNYSLFVPTDNYFVNYIDPLSYTKDVKAAMKYWYNNETKTVNGTVYSYDQNTGTVGDSINVIKDEDFLVNRLLDLLDAHIVIGNVESGSQYYFTKNGNALKVQGSGTELKVQGGDDIKKDIYANVVTNGAYVQQNGTTYFIDKPLQTPLQSVYKVLSETPEFSEFFALLDGFGSDKLIFLKAKNFYGMDYNISFFNTFNYTVYVPTNEAIQNAIANKTIDDWDYINSISDDDIRDAEIDTLERFLRYHFQDNSVYIGGASVDELYQTATLKTDDNNSYFGTYKNKYFRIGVRGDGSSLTLTTENGGTANVITENGFYNIMTRDYVFSDNPQAYTEADGSGSGKEFSSSSITTSSMSVIHQIDNVLKFE